MKTLADHRMLYRKCSTSVLHPLGKFVTNQASTIHCPRAVVESQAHMVSTPMLTAVLMAL